MIVKMDTFGTFLLDHEDFISGKSFVSVHNDFEHLWYLAKFSWGFQLSWYACISAITLFSHKMSRLLASIIHIVQEKEQRLF